MGWDNDIIKTFSVSERDSEMDGSERMENRLVKKFAWLSVGCISGLVIALMVITGSRSLNAFYDGGMVCDMPEAGRNANFYGVKYGADDGTFVITDENAYKIFSLYGKEACWNYIFFELSKINCGQIDTEFAYYNQKGECVGTKEVALQEGRNVVQTEGMEYVSLTIRIQGQTGATIRFDKVQFREKKVDFRAGQFLWIWSIIFFVYGIATVLLKKWYGKTKRRMIDWYTLIDGLQGFYIEAGNYLGGKTLCISARMKEKIRTVLFLFLILYMQVIMDLGLYETDQYYKVQMLVCSIVVIAVGVLCYEKKLHHVDWKNTLVCAWLVLWILACVSDFFIAKRYSFLGYIMLFPIGFFFFVWSNMSFRERIVHEFISAVRISFAVIAVFCFLCRPWQEGTRYTGSYYNPGMFAMYMLYVWIALWGDIDVKMEKEKLSPFVFIEAAAAVLAGLLIWRTQSSSGIIPAFLVFAVFVFKRSFLSKSGRGMKRMLLILAFAAGLAYPVAKAGTWGLMHLPHILETEIVMPNDQVIVAQTISEPVHVFAAEEDRPDDRKMWDSRIIRKVFGSQTLELFTSGRNYYWAAYLRAVNLLGHRNKERFFGGSRWPHNGFIALIYRYGIFTIIPYVIMVFVNLACAWKYMLTQKNGYGYFLFAGMLAGLILILMENLELPFLFLCWLHMYLMMGIHFMQEEKQAIAGGHEKEDGYGEI